MEFYYSFNINYEKKMIVISIDEDIKIEFLFDKYEFNPVLCRCLDKYTVSLKNLCYGIDVIYELTKSEVKETIVVKNKYAEKTLCIGVNTSNLKVYKTDFKYVFSDSSNNEVFSMPFPYVVENDGYLDKKYVTMNYIDNSFIYEFKNEIVRKFPVKIDPSMNFATKIKSCESYQLDCFDKYNTMLVTSTNYGYEYIDGTVPLSKDIEMLRYNCKYFSDNLYSTEITTINAYSPNWFNSYGRSLVFTDDVIFHKKCRLIFPWLEKGDVSVLFRLNDTTYEKSEVLNKGSYGEVIYAYVDFELPVSESGILHIECNLNVFESNKIIAFNRKVAYIVDVSVQYDRNINWFSNNDIYKFIAENISVKHLEIFKPLSYSIIPYDICPKDNDKIDDFCFYMDRENSEMYLDISETDDFVVNHKKIDNDGRYLSVYFDVYSNYVPDNIFVQYEEKDLYTIKKGDLYSFKNKLCVILKSAIHNRSNSQEKNVFKSSYTYFSNNDINDEYQIDGENMVVKHVFKLKTFWSFCMKNDMNVSSASSAILIKEMSENIEENHTVVELLNSQNFIATYSGDFPIHYDVDKYKFIKYFKYNNMSDVDGCWLVCDMGYGIVKQFKIISNTDNKIVLRGKNKDCINRSKRMIITFFNPTEILIYNNDNVNILDNYVGIEKIDTDGKIVLSPIYVKIIDGISNDIKISMNIENSIKRITKDIAVY